MKRRKALITGATAGIGEATARLLAKNGFDLVLTGRRNDRLQQIKEELSADTSIEILQFDVRDQKAVNEAIDSLSEEWKIPDVLINNAGNAHGLDVFHEGDVDDWEAMIDINVKGLLYVSKKITPGMVERKSGHIINIGSIAGKEVYPKGNVYCASKYAVDALSEGMRIDLNPYGIKVTQICPGLVNTEFSKVRFKGDMDKADNVYKGMVPLYGEDIAEIILFCVTRPANVNISDMVVLPTAQASATIVNREG
ncbi:MAG: SDR family NAD(P)-dependent oxidoreductase [Cyclobacteriaceae bacterium]|nr:SDR family NAD(P)-dependent oxidoreductase [Cyclobacteriaceae bacterium]